MMEKIAPDVRFFFTSFCLKIIYEFVNIVPENGCFQFLFNREYFLPNKWIQAIESSFDEYDKSNYAKEFTRIDDKLHPKATPLDDAKSPTKTAGTFVAQTPRQWTDIL